MSELRVTLLAGLLASGLLLAPVGWAAQTVAEPRTTASGTSNGSESIRLLEQQVESVLAEARLQQTQLAVQRQRLTQAESVNAWLPLLFVVMAGLALVCGVLGLRLWRMQQQLAQLQGAAPAAPPAATALAQEPAAPAPPNLPERSLLSGLGAAAVRLPVKLTQPRLGVELASGARDFGFGAGVPSRAASVEELLDLDQQVEFFLALGQAQSAIDLLLGHVRSTGGTNAQPYFKLLEIYRDLGDEEAYERTRERFNQRFNAHAPGWTSDLAGGRLLEDYPEVMQRLQRAWPQPLRTLAALDGLLLRRADLEPFDLPAYREILMLHALVRDLSATGLAEADAPMGSSHGMGQPTAPAVLARELPSALETFEPDTPAVTTVDLLLPLGEPMMDITLPQPHMADRPLAQAMLADWVFSRTARSQGTDGASADRPSSAMRLDLDLSEHAPAPREFTRPAAFTDIDMQRDRRLSDLGGLDDAEPPPSRR